MDRDEAIHGDEAGHLQDIENRGDTVVTPENMPEEVSQPLLERTAFTASLSLGVFSERVTASVRLAILLAA